MAFDKFGEKQGMDAWSQTMSEMLDEMLRRSYVQWRTAGTWQPQTNVYETRRAYHVCVDLAGLSAEEIDVQCVSPQRVSISGHRSQPRPPDAAGVLSVHVLEIDEGPFRRELELPEPIDMDAVEASYLKGFLWITLPKTHDS